jgi:hypothetical protein
MSDIEQGLGSGGDGTEAQGERDDANPNLTGAVEGADVERPPIDPPGGASPEKGAGSDG